MSSSINFRCGSSKDIEIVNTAKNTQDKHITFKNPNFFNSARK